MRILIVEDEKDLSMVLCETIEMEGYYADAAYNGTDGLNDALSGIYDLIILDIMLPGMDGIQVITELRQNHVDTPVLMLTAKARIEDKISGLDHGADDYLTKPFDINELLARIRAITRRREKTIIDKNMRFADITLDNETHEICKGTQRIKLTKKEYDIIELLILNKGKVVSKEKLTVKIWGYDTDIEYNSIEVYISFIRKKLNLIESSVYIDTIRGLGYIIKEKTCV